MYKFSFSATKKYRSKITNHSQLTWPFELHVKHTGQPHFWLVRFFFSDALSSLVWSYLLDSISLSRKYVTKHIIHIYSLHINKLKYKKNNFRFVMEEKPSSLFRIKSWLIPFCRLAVIVCGFISLLIGCETISIPEIFFGVHGFTTMTVTPAHPSRKSR